jgi:hypothetical protein
MMMIDTLFLVFFSISLIFLLVCGLFVDLATWWDRLRPPLGVLSAWWLEPC